MIQCAEGCTGLFCRWLSKEMDWLEGKLQHLELEIKAEQQELQESIKANESPELIDTIREEEARLVEEENEWSSTLQPRLASPSGDVLAASR